MGIYLNPGNEEFRRIIKTEFVDKSGMIELINTRMDTKENLLCISRPRRFGKSYAAQMLAAYYDYKCDSDGLFKNLEISKSKSYELHLNKYNVIYLDITGFISEMIGNGEALENITAVIKGSIIAEINELLPSLKRTDSISSALINLVDETGRKIVFIIDEWDAIIREKKDDELIQKSYLNFLRGIFKNGNLTPKVVAAAYMTGILPIKKDGTESAISDFDEYTIVNPGEFTRFTGFTDNEVAGLCEKRGIDYHKLKHWYDGYFLGDDESIYNPYSVMQSLRSGRFESYWQKTTAAESLFTYVNMDYAGLQDDIARLITGERIEVDISTFKNDVENFSSKDDVLTLLVHLGYLTYDSSDKSAKIPNEEIKNEFISLLKNTGKNRLASLVKESEKLLKASLSGEADRVAECIEKVRMSEYAPTFYNNEQALRYVIKFAYIICVDKYMKIEELPTGKGIADVVFLPKKTTAYPAMIVELKWNKNEEAALEQIKNREYPAVLKDYSGEIILVGINYDEKTKKHSCRIERVL